MHDDRRAHVLGCAGWPAVARRANAGALVLACAGAMTVLAAHRQSASGAGLIAGQVVDANSGQPIAGAMVSLRSLSRVSITEVDRDGRVTAVPRPAVVTDSQGRYVFTGLPAGDYTIQPQRDGYTPTGSALVVLATSDRHTNVPLRLGRRGSIAGTVRDDAGEPVVDVLVMAFLRTSLGGRSPLLMPRGTALTDDRGRYRVRDLQVGDYFVCVCGTNAPLFDPALFTVLPPPALTNARLATRADETLRTFAPTFYPDRRKASEATPIPIDFSDDRTGIDIGVTAVRTHRVSGQVVNSGDPTRSVQVSLVGQGDLPEAQALVQLSAAVTADGQFEFAAVPAGDYVLQGTLSTRDRDDPWVGASQPVSVGDADVSGLAVTMRMGVTVSGRVEYVGQALRPASEIVQKTQVTLVPVDLTPAVLAAIGGTGRSGYATSLDADGAFAFTDVVPGRYVLIGGTIPPTWQTIGSVHGTGGGVGHTVVSVGDGGLTGMLVNVVDTPPASVRGSVALRPYDMPGQFSVCLVPADRAMWPEPFANPTRFACQAVSPARTYVLTAVPPGEYFLALRHNWLVDWMAPRHLEAFARSAPRVTVRAGETATVNLER